MPARTIYLNQAGTSWPKPECVTDAAARVLQSDSTTWPSLFNHAHHSVAAAFHVAASRLLLTPSCTAALDIGITDHDWKTGDRILTSRFEHHALHRPILKLAERGVEVTQLPSASDELICLEALERELKAGDVRVVALTAACNVTGQLLPCSDAVALAHEFQALALIDGAQIAGWWELDLGALDVDLFTFAGHKGPQAPWGIGGLYVAPHVSTKSPLATCERAAGDASRGCATMPGYCDAGSANLAALAGLAAGMEWLGGPAAADRLSHSRSLASDFADSVRDMPGLAIHGDVATESKLPVVAVTVKDTPSTDLASALRSHGVIASGGFQCAPQAHQALGTDRSGVLRFSFGWQNHADDGRLVASLLGELCKG